MKLEISGQILEKYSNTKFHKNPSSGSQVVPRGWTDRQTDIRAHAHMITHTYTHTHTHTLAHVHDEANSPFLQF